MKKEIEGILGREGTQPAVKTEDGKMRLIYNLFDGFAGKKVKLTIEEIKEEEETEVEEIGWHDVEEDAGESWEYEEIEEESEADEEIEGDEGEEEEKSAD
jgi:predicted transcriptional regulator